MLDQCHKLASLALMSVIIQSCWTVHGSVQNSLDILQPYVPINNPDGKFSTEGPNTESSRGDNLAWDIQASTGPHMVTETASPKLHIAFTTEPAFTGTLTSDGSTKTLVQNMHRVLKGQLLKDKALHSYAKAPSIYSSSSNNRTELVVPANHLQKSDIISLKNSIYEILTSKPKTQQSDENKLKLLKQNTKSKVDISKHNLQHGGHFVNSVSNSSHIDSNLVRLLSRTSASLNHNSIRLAENNPKSFNTIKDSDLQAENSRQDLAKGKGTSVFDVLHVANNDKAKVANKSTTRVLDLLFKEVRSKTISRPSAIFTVTKSGRDEQGGSVSANGRGRVVNKRSVSPIDHNMGKYANLNFLLPASLPEAEESTAIFIPVGELAFLPLIRDLNNIAFIMENVNAGYDNVDIDEKGKKLAEDIGRARTKRQKAKSNFLRKLWEFPLLQSSAPQFETRSAPEVTQQTTLQDSTSTHRVYALLIPRLGSATLSDEKRSKNSWRRFASRRYPKARNGKKRHPSRQRMWSILSHRSRDSQRIPLQVYRRPWRQNPSVVHQELETHGRRPPETLGDEGSPHINGVREMLIHRAHVGSLSPLQETPHRSRSLYQIEEEIARRQLGRRPLATRWAGTR